MSLDIDENGYVNVTKLCKCGGKNIGSWNRLEKTREFLNILSQELRIPVQELIKYKKGGNKERSSWAHPYVATNIAMWISAEFSVKVSIWIDNWKNLNIKNTAEYKNAVEEIVQNPKVSKEHLIRDKLALIYNGEIEVECKYGRIDIVTTDKIIELKKARNWKQALGQILIYSSEYPDKKMCIYLFDTEELSIELSSIKIEYKKFNVHLLDI